MSKRYAITAVLLILLSSGCTRKETEVSVTPAAAIVRLDPTLDELVTVTTPIEKIASGHDITEGPVYAPEDISCSAISRRTRFSNGLREGASRYFGNRAATMAPTRRQAL